MSKNLKIVLLVFAGIMLIFIVFAYTNNSEIKTEVNNDISEEKFMETSEIAKHDKDFYKISHKTNSNKTKDSAKNKKIASSNMYLERLKGIFMMKSADVGILDKVMNALLTDKSTSRIDKINGLWDILNEIGFDAKEKSLYLLQSLATLLPIELTDSLMNAYKDSRTSTIKIELINMLADNLSIANPEVQDKESLAFIIEKTKDIQTFLKENILNESDTRMASEGLHAFAKVSDAQDVQELIASLEQGGNKAQLDKPELTSILTEVALSTEETQQDILPSMLNAMQNDVMLDSQQKEEFNQMMISSLNAGVLSAEMQGDLATYLEKQEPKVLLTKRASTGSLLKYYDWAEASSKIKSNDMHLENMALENDNPLKVSSILLYADDLTIEKLKENPNAEQVYARLEASLEDEGISQANKVIIKDAMGRLDENTEIISKDKK